MHTTRVGVVCVGFFGVQTSRDSQLDIGFLKNKCIPGTLGLSGTGRFNGYWSSITQLKTRVSPNTSMSRYRKIVY